MYTAAILISSLLSALLTAWLLPKVVAMSRRIQLFDSNDKRRVHKGLVPRLGGIAFLPAIIIACSLTYGAGTLLLDSDMVGGFSTPKVALTLCALFTLYMEGVADDICDIGYKPKFLCQFFCSLLVVCSGIWLNDLHGLFGLHALPAWVGMPLSVLLSMFVINAFNLIDGIDGLSSGLGIIALSVLGCAFVYTEHFPYALLAFTFAAALVPFFCYNVFGQAGTGNKIFMGDTGSQCLGFVVALLAVRLAQHYPDDPIRLPNELVTAAAVLIVPCFDALRVMTQRMLKKKHPFKADLTHIHHLCLSAGMTQRSALLLLLTAALAFVLLNVLLAPYFGATLLLLLDLLLWATLTLALSSKAAKKTPKG